MNKVISAVAILFTLTSMVAIESHLENVQEEEWVKEMGEYIERLPEDQRPVTDAECEAFEKEWIRFHKAIKKLTK